LPCPCRPTAIALAHDGAALVSAARLLLLGEADVRVVEEAGAVLHDVVVSDQLVVEALGVPLGDAAVGENPRVAEDQQHILLVELALAVTGGVVGLPGDVVDGLRVDDPVLLGIATALLGAAARQDVHAIVC
jgi:hypothetical protein